MSNLILLIQVEGLYKVRFVTSQEWDIRESSYICKSSDMCVKCVSVSDLRISSGVRDSLKISESIGL
jgi:hypothetical protein